jgi:hypothetical protein
MRFFTLPALLAAAVVSAVVVIPFLPEAKSRQALLLLEARLASTSAGYVQVYYDTGTGYNENASVRLPLALSATPLLYQLPLSSGTFRSLRFDPINHDGTVTIASLRVVTPGGSVVRTIAFSEINAGQQIASLRESADQLEVIVEPRANDPQLSITFTPPLEAHVSVREFVFDLFTSALGVFIALAALLFALERAPVLRAKFIAATVRLSLHPGRALALVAGLAVVASAYPVLFLGKSYVSPNFGTTLLYETYPTLPASTAADFINSKGSDVGAIMWQHVPYSFVQHRALVEGELPLWNRYNFSGLPLLGQGQSMFGDPLHFFVVLANGAAWAWDLKFLIAKWLFALGLGLIVSALTRHLPAAALVSVAAPFVGFFVYRINHPAFFSLCYAPWALYCWVRAIQAGGVRATAWWAVALIGANAALMNSGTVKEAYMLLFAMNFSGGCMLLAADAPWRVRFAKLAGLTWSGAIFALLTAPIWATFLHTLGSAHTAYDTATAYQIQPALLLGLFDEAFYRPLMNLSFVFNPALNFLLLLGLLYFLATLRFQAGNRLALALAASSMLPLALAFGLVPASWIVQVPLLANVSHIDNTFSCALIILWAVVAGVGFASAASRLGAREGRGDLAIGGLMLGGLVFSWIAFRQTVHRPTFGEDNTFTVLKTGQSISVDAFVWGYLVALLVAVVAFAWVVRHVLLKRTLSSALALVVAAAVVVMLWRQGLQAEAVGFENYCIRPPPRVDFHANSEAVALMQSTQASEPSRGFGLHGNFFPGWTSDYGLEAISGPDALVNRWYHELTGNSPVPQPWAWDFGVTPDDLKKARPFFDALNVRYYLTLHSDPAVMGRTLDLVKAADLDVYESPTVWPRAFFTDRLERYDDAAEFVKAIGTGDGRPFAAAQRAELAAEPALRAIPAGLNDRTVAAATNYRLTENTTSFDVHASGPGVVVLTETFWPGDFRAEVNGRKAPVQRLNHAFKGVVLDAAGDYHIAFRCEPKNFPRNLMLSGVGAVALLGSMGWVLRRHRA